MASVQRGRSGRRRPLALALCAVLGAVGLAAAPDVGAHNGVTSTFLADPDTVATRDGRYATYGTSVRNADACGVLTVTPTYWRVPVILHGHGEHLGFGGACITADAMPAPLPRFMADDDIWAPTVVHYNGRYRMWFGYRRAGSWQRCIGYAESTSPIGPFGGHRDWACPPNGRWAIDPDATVWDEGPGADGGLYITYRDDHAVQHGHTALSVVQVDQHGWAFWSTRRTLLTTVDVAWDTWNGAGTGKVVENPSMVYATGSKGTGYYVFFSGNEWNSARYSSGAMFCGTPIPAAPCEQLAPTKPYFGYSASGLDPHRHLPLDPPGGGALSFFTDHAGHTRAVWHYWLGSTTRDARKAGMGLFRDGPDGFAII